MKGLLSKTEILIVGVFMLIFLFWAGSKCKETKVQLQEEALVQAIEDSLANAKKLIPEKAQQGDILEEALKKKKTELAAAAAKAKPDSLKGLEKPVATKPAALVLQKLYVTIDKLKLRTEPGLKSEVLGELPLFSEVFFMEEVTDTTYQVNLGKEMAEEPYVKIKTRRGTVGWVYGAGVNYYKKKREGVY